MLGADVCAEFSRHNHDVVAVTSGHFDIGDTDATIRAIRDIHPDCVIHTAAYTDVDGCERNPDIAYRVNSLGTWNVAAGCAAVDSSIVVISTDFVFDGAKGTPYTEFDAPHALGVYGASKLEGEHLAAKACQKHYIVRTSWLYGPNGRCFPQTMLRLAQTRTELSVVADQTGTPTFTPDLAAALPDLIKTPLYGIHHITNSGETSWAGFAASVLKNAGKSDVSVKPIRSDEWPSPTRRPAYSVLRNYVREMRGQEPLRPWQDALSEYIKATASD